MNNIQEADRVIRELIDSPETHFWIANAMRTALSKDPVDAVHDFGVAYNLFSDRLAAMEVE